MRTGCFESPSLYHACGAAAFLSRERERGIGNGGEGWGDQRLCFKPVMPAKAGIPLFLAPLTLEEKRDPSLRWDDGGGWEAERLLPGAAYPLGDMHRLHLNLRIVAIP